MGEFLSLLPDPLEFMRIHRSYIVRLDKITKKSSRHVIVNNHKIPIGKTYRGSSLKIQL
jgi:DNA-binding LytR/AlgR family response regulator